VRYNKREMKALLIPAYYLSWHYTTAFAHILRIYRNVVFFSVNFFSIKLLLRTLFRPLRRSPIASTRPEDAEHAVVTFIMSFMGFMIRTVTVICGLCSLIITLAFWLAVFCLWVVLPFVSLGLFSVGLISFLK
jgi:hypothetical protein